MSRRNRLKKRKTRANDDEIISRVDSMLDFIVEDEDEEYEPQTSRGEYFDVDSKPLQDELILALSMSLKVPEHKISQAVSQVFDNISPYMLDDYLDEKPSNKSWKLGVDKKVIKRIEPQLTTLRSEMEKDIPTIPKILSANVTKEDKKRCLRFFDEMKNSEQYSSDYFRLQDSINEILGKSKFHSKEEIIFLEAEEERLKKMSFTLETLKTKILKLNASSEIKAKLLSQYEEMVSYPSDSPYYTTLKEEIEWL